MEFSDIKGLIFTSISVSEDKDNIEFIDNKGNRYSMYHYHVCCEKVTVDDINGDLSDLLNTEILSAEESTSKENGHGDDSFTWTFYHIRTIKGSVTIKWYGSSTGMYSETVDFIRSGTIKN